MTDRYLVDFNAVHDAGLVAIAETLGYKVVRGRSISPCPSCKAEFRSSRGHDRRGPIGLTTDSRGWRCHRCDAHGDAVTFAAWHVAATNRPADWGAVLEELAGRGWSTPPPAVHVAAGPPRRPPRKDLLDLWARSVPITQDADATVYLRGREIDPELVDDRGLARAIPAGLTPPQIPVWAHLHGTWPGAGYRLLLPMWDVGCNLATMHARNLAGATPKGAFPSGYEVRGSVFADPAGQRMLEKGELLGTLWVVEGAPDFLKTATSWSDEADIAVLGVVSGSWTHEIAARVPNGAHVVIAVHHDLSGERYVTKVVDSLAGRVRLERWAPRVVA
jgi:hypothetical protein